MAAVTYEYIMSLQDKMSSTMRSITGASEATISRLSALSSKAKMLKGTTADLGGSIYTLKQKLDLLKSEKELLPASNLKQIKQYNAEISGLEKQIDKLDNAGGGGKLKGYLGGIGGMFGGMLNPAIIGAAVAGFAGKAAMGFGQDMAKVNITAQLDEQGLAGLKTKLKQIAKDNKADITVVPVGFEKIISQTGDVDSSLQILDASLKGSKAGFVDLDTVTGALAQTLSIVGTKNASAQEVLDTFFAAKRVGAGEFKDFAAYIPGLVAGADALGMNYKSVAGTFAYMTGKGQDAARSSVLMGNMFSVLQKTDITSNLKKAGVAVFDNAGKMRGMVDIFKDLSGVMAGMSDEQKSGFLEKIGIVDKEAKSAFAIMSSDIEKLATAMDATANATGETSAALEFSKNPVQAATELWNQLKGVGLQLGDMVLPLVNISLDVFSGIMSIVAPLVEHTVNFLGGWVTMLQEGNPLVWGLTAALGGLVIALLAREAIEGRLNFVSKARTMWDGALTMVTKGATIAQWLFNTSLYACPLVWIIASVGALVTAVVVCWNKFEGFRKAIYGVWEVAKEFGKTLWDGIVGSIKKIVSGLGTLGQAFLKLFKGDFAGAWDSAKAGMADVAAGTIGISPVGMVVNAVVDGDYKKAWMDGTQKGADNFAASQTAARDKATKKSAEKAALTMPAGLEQTGSAVETPGGGNYAGLMDKLGGPGKDKWMSKNEKVLDLNPVAQQIKGTTSYSAIASRFAGVKMPSLTTAAAAVALPLAVAGTALPEPATPAPTQAQTEYADTSTPARQGVTIDRFCDQVVINIQNADGKGHDQIRQEITTVLKQILDTYEA